MDYLSFKFLKSGTDVSRPSDEKPRVCCSIIVLSLCTHIPWIYTLPCRSSSSIANASHLQKTSPNSSPLAGLAPSPSSIKSSNSASSCHPPSPRSPASRPILRLPNSDHLPTSFAALEGHLNHHTSQLQQLADRVEAINEWIELDNIVLARLVRDEEKRIDDAIAAERVFTSTIASEARKSVRFELGPRPNGTNTNNNLGPPPPLSPPMMADKGKRSASMGDVPRIPRQEGIAKEKTVEERKAEAVAAHGGIREVKERIRAMRRWRKEIERSV
ncbi:MAG: hypothetical protein Q9218_003199, partial [Villophora microphyllina]